MGEHADLEGYLVILAPLPLILQAPFALSVKSEMIKITAFPNIRNYTGSKKTTQVNRLV